MKFKKGDAVISYLHGPGIVESIRDDDEYPVGVVFSLSSSTSRCRRDSYTLNGFLFTESLNPDLFLAEEYPACFPKHLPRLKRFHPVLVWNEGDSLKQYAVFDSFNESRIVTSKDEVTYQDWDYFEVINLEGEAE